MNNNRALALLLTLIVVGSIDTLIGGFIGHRVTESIHALAESISHIKQS